MTPERLAAAEQISRDPEPSSSKKSPNKVDRMVSGQFDLANEIPPKQNSPEIYRKTHVQRALKKLSAFNQTNAMTQALKVGRPQSQQLDPIQENASQAGNMNDLLVVMQYESSDDRRVETAFNACQTVTSDPINTVERRRELSDRRKEMNIAEKRMSATQSVSGSQTQFTPGENPFLARMKLLENKRQQKLSMLRRARPSTV